MVDSSVWIDAFNGVNSRQVKGLSNILGRENIFIGDFILTEVLQGFYKDEDFKEIKAALNEFPCVRLLNKEIAIKSAENYRALRKIGITIRKTIDVFIATFCIENNFILLHNDPDFDPIEKHLGLKVFIFQ
ncbi:MAG: PIN domain nuclease [Ignavibacteriaceae bacterium]